MRTIKFRAWDVRNKEMYMVSKLNFRENYDVFRVFGKHHNKNDFHIENPDDTILMQFTGLKDKNGKEIYEGDIVRWDDCSGGKYWRIAEVSFNPDIQFKIIYFNIRGLKKFNMKNSKLNEGYIFHFGSFIYKDTHNYLEIIGNIYETKDLLI
jgi:uncharacterized phage protein (TIGR01671 family)